MVLLPDGLNALKRVAKVTGLMLTGAYRNLDAGFDSTYNRKCIFNAGMLPNIQENPRNRKSTKRGRKRLFNEALHSILKFFQVDSTGMFRMTSSARYFKKGVGSSRPHWRWIMGFVEGPKANTSCKAWVKCFSLS